MSVVLFHAGLGCPGGFVGVDVFFVISGFLITRILEKDLQAGKFSVLRFYERRIRRIFPALFATILAICFVGLFYLPPDELKDLGKCIAATSAFASNVLLFRRAGYFDSSSLSEPLLHTWTLSVEEQFYIFWPWILALLQLRWFKRWSPFAVLVLISGTLTLSSFWTRYYPEAAFYLLPSRGWELAIGALLSMAPIPDLLRRVPRRVADAVSLVGLLMVISAVLLYTERVPFPGVAALLPCTGAGLVIASGEGGPTLAGRWLSWKPIVFIGLISYSLYLWHWPILVFVRLFLYGQLNRNEGAICTLLAILVSALSWHFIEKPFRERNRILGSSRVWMATALVTSALFLLIGLVLDWTAGFQRRSPEVARWVAEEAHRTDVQLTTSPCLAWGSTLPPVQQCLLGASSWGPITYSVALWGDSNGAHLAPAFQTIDQQLGIITREITKAGCPPLIGIRFLPVDRMTVDCPAFNDNAMKVILTDAHIRVVVIAARWIPLADGTMAAPLTGRSVSMSESRSLFVQALRRSVSTIVESGRQVILVSQVPSPSLSPVTCLARARFNHWSEEGCDTMPADPFAAEERQIDSALSEAIKNTPGVRIVYPFNILCHSASCRLVQNGEPLYWDMKHLSDVGARLLLPELETKVNYSLQPASASTGN